MNAKIILIPSLAVAAVIGLTTLPMLKSTEELVAVEENTVEQTFSNDTNQKKTKNNKQQAIAPATNVATVKEENQISEATEVAEMNDFLRDQMAFLNNPELIQKRQESITRRLVDVLSTETYDWHWSNEIKEKFANSKHLLPGAEQVILQNVDCRETICELQLDYENAEARERWAPLVRHIGKLIGSDSYTYYGKGSELTKIYISQPGEKLSLFDRTENKS